MTISNILEIAGKSDIGLWLLNKRFTTFFLDWHYFSTLRLSGNIPVLNIWFIFKVFGLISVTFIILHLADIPSNLKLNLAASLSI